MTAWVRVALDGARAPARRSQNQFWNKWWFGWVHGESSDSIDAKILRDVLPLPRVVSPYARTLALHLRRRVFFAFAVITRDIAYAPHTRTFPRLAVARLRCDAAAPDAAKRMQHRFALRTLRRLAPARARLPANARRAFHTRTTHTRCTRAHRLPAHHCTHLRRHRHRRDRTFVTSGNKRQQWR